LFSSGQEMSVKEKGKNKKYFDGVEEILSL
jgi:hypothetical protein